MALAFSRNAHIPPVTILLLFLLHILAPSSFKEAKAFKKRVRAEHTPLNTRLMVTIIFIAMNYHKSKKTFQILAFAKMGSS